LVLAAWAAANADDKIMIRKGHGGMELAQEPFVCKWQQQFSAQIR